MKLIDYSLTLKALSQLKKKGRKIGKLRFKKRGSFKTIHYNQSGFNIIQTKTRLDKLHISKIGDIPMRMHRNVDGKIKQVIIKKYRSGKWFVCINAETESVSVKQPIKYVVGIDVGIKHFLTDSDDKQIENPHYLKNTLKQLRRQQKRLSNKQRNFNNWKRQKIKIARLHEKVLNQRNDYLHKLARYYVSNYDMIAIEELNIKNMVRNKYLAQSISDVSWHRFARMLSYKTESAGKTLVRVDPKNTSRIYRYGDSLDRDYNASLNILERDLNEIGQGLSEFTPVGIRPLQELVTISASQMVESGSLSQNRRILDFC